MGWYRPVHAKSSPAQDARALLLGRKLLQSKLLDVELSIGGMKRAKVALARKPGVVLHHFWMDATDFRWSANPMAA